MGDRGHAIQTMLSQAGCLRRWPRRVFHSCTDSPRPSPQAATADVNDEGVTPAAGAAAQAANPPGLASSACSSTSAADLHLELPGTIVDKIHCCPLLQTSAGSVTSMNFQSSSRLHQYVVRGRCQSTITLFIAESGLHSCDMHNLIAGVDGSRSTSAGALLARQEAPQVLAAVQYMARLKGFMKPRRWVVHTKGAPDVSPWSPKPDVTL